MCWFRKRYKLEDLFVLFIYTESDSRRTYKLESFKITTTKNLKGKLFGSPNHVVCLDGSSYAMSTFSHIAALDGKALITLLSKDEKLPKRITKEDVFRLEKELNESYFSQVKNNGNTALGDFNIDVGELF